MIRDDHNSLVSHGSRTPGTLDCANAFLFPGGNSRTELVPSPWADARNGVSHWLGDYDVAMS